MYFVDVLNLASKKYSTRQTSSDMYLLLSGDPYKLYEIFLWGPQADQQGE